MQAERRWLQWVERMAAAAAPRRRELRLGIGDDAALIEPRKNRQLAITTDLFVEDVHFLRARDTPESCGYRLATRALSDLAAMGAEPLALLVSAAFPPKLPRAWTQRLYRALLHGCREAGAGLVGGDLSASAARRDGGKILLDVVGVGQVRRNRALRRDGASAGDFIFVSGVLGMSERGRRLIHARQQPHSQSDRRARARYRRPKARWRLGMRLAGERIATAAIDLSDGLSTDLTHLCEASGVGARIEEASLPLLPVPDGLKLGLDGGEDYELLFTIQPRRLDRLRPMLHRFQLRQIGIITAESGIWIRRANGRRQRLLPGGWQHFA